nr:hypothetical protein CFP56_42212 [Quercus suber]
MSYIPPAVVSPHNVFVCLLAEGDSSFACRSRCSLLKVQSAVKPNDLEHSQAPRELKAWRMQLIPAIQAAIGAALPRSARRQLPERPSPNGERSLELWQIPGQQCTAEPVKHFRHSGAKLDHAVQKLFRDPVCNRTHMDMKKFIPSRIGRYESKSMYAHLAGSSDWIVSPSGVSIADLCFDVYCSLAAI